MRQLALSDEILMNIDKPARYIGNEVNMVRKNPKAAAIRFAMCFPDVYEIGMSHLGIQILYDMFNRREDVYCERERSAQNHERTADSAVYTGNPVTGPKHGFSWYYHTV